jgi:hypothetical protein
VELGELPVRTVDTLAPVLSVGDAVEFAGGWALLDPRARQVHLLGPGGELRSFGREGEGPGEMEMPVRLDVDGAVLGVVEAGGHRLVRYDTAGSILAPVSLSVRACMFGPALGVRAAPTGGFVVLRTCTGFGGSTEAVLLGIDPEGAVRVVVRRRLHDPARGLDPFAIPILARAGDTLYLGTLAEGCLHPVDLGGVGPTPPDPVASPGAAATPESAAPLCAATGPPVRLPRADRERLAVMGARFEEAGRTLEIPRHLPRFTEVHHGPRRPAFRVPLEPEREALDLVGRRGERIRIELPVDPPGIFIGSDHLLIARELAGGTEVRRLERPRTTPEVR